MESGRKKTLKRQGDFKEKQTVDDILKLFAITGEHKLTDSIPRFVAEDLTKIPFVNADSINVLAMAKKLETLENRLSSTQFMYLGVNLHQYCRVLKGGKVQYNWLVYR